ncbi:hypothetical protein M422DRAFT_271494 [Sphaerobolus stellatus SS14]|uniref:Uncharacterized protein n=1 Tax=Sphaerobolus stellatus (strain SS14) TaxID=990650 RepID=A0A0C9UPP7_SPHS4|nr:hypothetical protein M422DRAFT_271494 [Sphaerobolus stellatus SS14]
MHFYYQVHEDTGNFIVSSVVSFDGKLTTGEVVWVGGVGVSGNTGKAHNNDPIFSQGIITVSSNKVYTVNKERKTSLIGQPVYSGGEFPVSVAVSKKTGGIAVLNGGTINGISLFTQNESAGVALIPNTIRFLELNQTTPESVSTESVSQVLFKEDEIKLIAAVKGVSTSPASGLLAVWDLDSSKTGAPQTYTKIPISVSPFNFTLIPGKNSVLLSDSGVGYDIVDFTHSTSATYPIANRTNICWSAFSKKTGNTTILSSIITELGVDPKTTIKSSTVKQYSLSAGSILLDADIASILEMTIYTFWLSTTEPLMCSRYLDQATQSSFKNFHSAML